jgi:drug/metabolite transporter (DMT)-like permease
MGVVYAALSAIGWGTSTYVAGLGTEVLDAGVGTALSLYASALWAILVALVLAPLGAWSALGWRGVLAFASVGLLNFPLARALLYAAVRDLGPSRAMALRGAGPVFAVALAVALGQGMPSALVLAGIGLMVLGAVLLGLEQARSPVPGATPARGFLLGSLAAVGFGAVPVLVRAFLPTVQTPLVGVVVALVTGALAQTAVVAATGRLSLLRGGAVGRGALGTYLLSGALSGNANATNYLAVELLGAPVTAALVSAAPLVTLLASRILRRHREQLTRALYGAGVLVVLGGVAVSLAALL